MWTSTVYQKIGTDVCELLNKDMDERPRPMLTLYERLMHGLGLVSSNLFNPFVPCFLSRRAVFGDMRGVVRRAACGAWCCVGCFQIDLARLAGYDDDVVEVDNVDDSNLTLLILGLMVMMGLMMMMLMIPIWPCSCC